MSTPLDRVIAASARVSEAQKQDAAARAEWARLELLQVADANPGIDSFNVDYENEYDEYDGGSYERVTILAEWSEEEGDVESELSEIADFLTAQAVGLFGYGKTVNQLRDLRF